MAARHDIEAARDCKSLPAAEGESAVGSLFVKLDCEMTDKERGIRILLRTNYFRKPGQSGVNPQLPTQLTVGQFEEARRGWKSARQGRRPIENFVSGLQRFT